MLNFLRYFPNGEHILGDKTYPVLNWLMAPYKNDRRLSRSQKLFNLKLSRTRCVIDRSFALLKGRFRRLKYLDMKVKYVSATILACCVLHNMCLDEGNDDFLNEGLDETSAERKLIILYI